MKVAILTEVIPVWYVEKWNRENAEIGSAIDQSIKAMLKDWKLEEKRGDV